MSIVRPEDTPRGLPTDEQIVEGLCRGDAASAMALYDRYVGMVNRLVWRFLGADGEHDDMVQHVFTTALASASRIRHAEALRSWLVSLTINTVRTELRHRRYRRWVVPSAEVNELVPAYHDDPEGRELLARLYAILRKLNVDDRIAFTLRYIEGSSLDEIAAVCACSIATVKRRIKSAEEKLDKLAAKEPAFAAYRALREVGQ